MSANRPAPTIRAAITSEYSATADCTADVVVPETDDGLHPLVAVYATSCLAAVEQAIAADHLKVTSIFREVRVARLGESCLREAGHDPAMLTNVNTPEDYRGLTGDR